MLTVLIRALWLIAFNGAEESRWLLLLVETGLFIKWREHISSSSFSELRDESLANHISLAISFSY